MKKTIVICVWLLAVAVSGGTLGSGLGGSGLIPASPVVVLQGTNIVPVPSGTGFSADYVKGAFKGTTQVQTNGYYPSNGNADLVGNYHIVDYGGGFQLVATNAFALAFVKCCVAGPTSPTNATIYIDQVSTTNFNNYGSVFTNGHLYTGTVTLPQSTYASYGTNPITQFDITPPVNITNGGYIRIYFFSSNTGRVDVSCFTGAAHNNREGMFDIYATDGGAQNSYGNGYFSADCILGGYASIPIVDLSTYVSNLQSIYAPRVVMPSSITAVVGDELQIFVRGVLEHQSPFSFNYGFSSGKGTNYPRYWDYTPAAGDVGTTNLSFSVFDSSGGIISSNYSILTTVGAGSSPSSNITVLCVGDSLTEGGQWPTEFLRRLTQSGGSPAGKAFSNIKFAGDHQMTAYTTQYFMGYGGWKFQNYISTNTNNAVWVTAAGHDKTIVDISSTWGDTNNRKWTLMQINGNALKLGNYGGAGGYGLSATAGTLTNVSGGTHTTAITFTANTPTIQSPLNNTNGFSFLSTNVFNGTNISICYVLLGWNTVLDYSTAQPDYTNFTSYLTNLTAFAKQLRTDYPNAQLRVVGIQTPSPNGGLGYNYGSYSMYSQYLQMLQTVNGLNKAYDVWCSTNSFARYISVAAEFDADNNSSVVSVNVNTRSATTENRGNNGVHPATAGYYQIADACWRDFIRSFCQ